jgi:prepilin-type processing-associated H-X9-DG protein
MNKNTRWNNGYASYGFNDYGLDRVNAWPWYYKAHAKFGSIANPSQTVLHAEAAACLAAGDTRGYCHVNGWTDTANPVAYPRHPQSGCNVLWADAHASSVAGKSTTELYSDAKLGLPWGLKSACKWDRE